ncbi:MAG: hypothetical protein ACI8SZ_002258, partial [Colwellia sp.]
MKSTANIIEQFQQLSDKKGLSEQQVKTLSHKYS